MDTDIDDDTRQLGAEEVTTDGDAGMLITLKVGK